MKQTLKFFIIILAAVFAMPQSYAQGYQKKERMNREELANVQARHIARELAFDEEVTNKFVDTYCRCQQEKWALGPRANAASATGEAAGDEIEARFDHTQKILDLRRKYYKEYSTFLTQEQIKRVYEIEKQMMRRLAKHKKSSKKRR